MKNLHEPLKVGKDEMVLYFAEGSYYSDKARIAMIEKSLEYENAILDLDKRENLSPWYMKINPKGTVPTLQHGDKFIPECDAIIQYIEDNFESDEPPLQPDRESDLGQQVEKLTKQLCSLDITVITYGSLLQDLNPHSKPLQSFFKRRRDRFHDTIVETIKLGESNPDLKENYLEKSRVLKEKVAKFYDQELYEAEIIKVKEVLGKVDDQLKIAAEKEFEFLYGDEFTLADVNLCLILNRLWATGLSKILFETCLPLCHTYYNRCHRRLSFKQVSIAFIHQEATRYSIAQMKSQN